MLVRDEILAEEGKCSAWPEAVPVPSWCESASRDGIASQGERMADDGWQVVVKDIAEHLASDGVCHPSTLSRFFSAAAWLLLLAVFGAAYVQGAEFAATKESASAWGVVIGLSAFFAWLAVDENEAAGWGDDELVDDIEEEEEEEPVSQAPRERKSRPKRD